MSKVHQNTDVPLFNSNFEPTRPIQQSCSRRIVFSQFRRPNHMIDDLEARDLDLCICIIRIRQHGHLTEGNAKNLRAKFRDPETLKSDVDEVLEWVDPKDGAGEAFRSPVEEGEI